MILDPKIKLRHLLLFFLVTAGLYQSCKDEDTIKEEAKTLVSYEKITTITAQKIQLGFSLLSLAYPEINKLKFGNPNDADLYKVKYRTKLNNKEIIASGVVCVPKSTGSFPILSFQNGTNTTYSNAPSMNIDDPQFVVLENLTGLGYIITIPDYIGFGESSQVLHPYYHRESNDAAVINLIKATQEMLEEKSFTCSANGKLFLMGYSQGGWATLSAFKTLEENNPTGLNPIAASCGAGAYNLMEVAKYILNRPTYGSPVYLPYFIESHQRNGLLNTSLDLYFNKPYVERIPDLFDGKHNFGSINGSLNDTIEKMMTPAMIQNFATASEFEALRNELTLNSVDAWQVKGKLLFMHGTKDPVVPVFESENIIAKFRELGLSHEQVELILIQDVDHGSGIAPWVISSLVWLDGMK